MAKKINLQNIKKKAKADDLLGQIEANGQTETKKKETKTKAKKGSVGRPKKAKEDLLSAKVLMNLTEAEKKSLEALSEKEYHSMAVGKVVRELLKKNGYF